MNTVSASLEITLRCLNCGEVIAVNACVNTLYCPSCSGKSQISDHTWTLLLQEILAELKGMHIGEAKRTVLEQDKTGTVRITLRRIPPDTETYNYLKPIPSGIAPGTDGTFSGEDKFQIAEAEQKSKIEQTIKIECASCGGTLETTGKNRTVNCTYCNSNNLIADDIWHRLHPSDNIRTWYVSFNTDDSVTLKPWNYGNIKSVCYGKEDLLYCVGESNSDDYAVWAMSTEGELIWMNLIPKDKRWKDEYFSSIILLSDGRLLIWNEYVHCALLYEAKTGDFIGETGSLEPHDSKIHHFDLYFCESLAADPDGSMVALINQRILRYSNEGIGIPTWPGTKGLKSLYKKRDKNSDEISVYNMRNGKLVLAQKLKNKSKVYPAFSSTNPTVEIDSESSVYILVPLQTDVKRYITGGALLTKFDKNGKIDYKADLGIYCTEKLYVRIDKEGFAYVLMTDSKADQKDMGRIVRISPDGKTIDTIVKANYRILNPSDYVFTVSPEGNIHIIGNGGVMRTYNREGDLIWRSAYATELDKEVYDSL